MWEDTNDKPDDDEPDNANNHTQSFTANDFAKGNKVVIEHFFNEQRTQVTIDATVAKQLLKDLSLDPLSYADFDHIPPIRKEQLEFLVARIYGVVKPAPPLDEAVDDLPDAGKNLHMEPTLDVDNIADKPFMNTGTQPQKDYQPSPDSAQHWSTI
jgi:hypothetical protein